MLPYQRSEIDACIVDGVSVLCALALLATTRTRSHRLLLRQLRTLCCALIAAGLTDIVGTLLVHVTQCTTVCWLYKALWRYFLAVVMLIEMHVSAGLAAAAMRRLPVLNVLYRKFYWVWALAILVDVPFLVWPTKYYGGVGWCVGTRPQRLTYVAEIAVSFVFNSTMLAIVVLTSISSSGAAVASKSLQFATWYVVIFLVVWAPYLLYYVVYTTPLGKSEVFTTGVECLQNSCAILITCTYVWHCCFIRRDKRCEGSKRNRPFDYHVGFRQELSHCAIPWEQHEEIANAEEETKSIQEAKDLRSLEEGLPGLGAPGVARAAPGQRPAAADAVVGGLASGSPLGSLAASGDLAAGNGLSPEQRLHWAQPAFVGHGAGASGSGTESGESLSWRTGSGMASWQVARPQEPVISEAPFFPMSNEDLISSICDHFAVE